MVLVLVSGCETKPQKLTKYKQFNDTIDVYLQIDSIAYSNPALALNLLETAYSSQKKTDSLQTAYYLYFKGRATAQQGDETKQALSHFKEALVLAKSLKRRKLSVKIYQEMAIAYSGQRKLSEAMQMLDSAFYLAEKINYKEIADLYIEASWVMYELDANNPKAKEYLSMAIEKQTNKSDSVFLAKVYHNMATIYMNENKLDSAFEYVNVATRIFKKAELLSMLCKTYNTLGAIYEKKRNTNEALRFYKLSAQTGDSAGIETAFIYGNIARYYHYILNDKQQALDYYLITLNKVKNPKEVYTLLESVASIYDELGNKEKALDYYKKSMLLKNADLEQNYQKNINRMEVEFDVKRKNHTIKEQTLVIQNQYLQSQRQRVFIFSLIAVMLMATVAIVLFIRQRNTKQEYEKVILEQQLLRSQMNPHFIFNAISVIQYLVKSKENKQADKYLSKFSRLLRKSLENSTEQFTPVQDEVKLLEDYLALQQLRFTNEFEYAIETYDNFEDDFALVPPMLIQPFVENCIEHGIRNIDRKGIVKIELTRTEKTIVCVVNDNGKGLLDENDKEKAPKRSLSTKISKKRLKIIEKKLKIESKIELIDKMETSGEPGVMVILTIPVKND